MLEWFLLIICKEHTLRRSVNFLSGNHLILCFWLRREGQEYLTLWLEITVQNPITTIVCKKYWKNCVSSEKAVTASETLTEYTMRSCTTIASNNCRLYDLRLGSKEIREFGWKEMKSSNYNLVPSLLSKNSIL